MKVQYQLEQNLSPAEFRSLLISSTLGERRPVNEPERIEKMCKYANLIITARLDGELIGVSRALSDFAFCTYLSCLAVDKKYQHQGIGSQLIEKTKEAAPKGKVILLSAPQAMTYYPKVGMTLMNNCFIL